MGAGLRDADDYASLKRRPHGCCCCTTPPAPTRAFAACHLSRWRIVVLPAAATRGQVGAPRGLGRRRGDRGARLPRGRARLGAAAEPSWIAAAASPVDDRAVAIAEALDGAASVVARPPRPAAAARGVTRTSI